MVSHTRFKVHEAVGLVDPNSLNDQGSGSNAKSSAVIPQDVASARILNPQHHHIMHNFGFAEETVSREVLIDASGMFSSSFVYPPNQRRVLSHDKSGPGRPSHASPDGVASPPFAGSASQMVAQLKQEIHNGGKSTGNLAGASAGHRN